MQLNDLSRFVQPFTLSTTIPAGIYRESIGNLSCAEKNFFSSIIQEIRPNISCCTQCLRTPRIHEHTLQYRQAPIRRTNH